MDPGPDGMVLQGFLELQDPIGCLTGGMNA